MKKVLFLIFIIFMSCAFLHSINVKEPTYEVLQVVEGDKFYLDLNHNKKIDNDELFHLRGVNSFPIKYNYKTAQYASRFNLSVKEALELGYFARNFSKEMLEHKFVSIVGEVEPYSKNYDYRFITIKFSDTNYAEILLKNGFGFSYLPYRGGYYTNFENKDLVLKNVKNAQKFKIKAYEKDEMFYYDLDCSETSKLKNVDFMPEDILISKKYEKSPYCYSKDDFNKEFEKYAEKIEDAKADFKAQNLEFFIINPLKYMRPSKKCRTSACQALLREIAKANFSIDFAIYGLCDQDDIARALISAKARGVKIRGVTDTNANGEYAYSETSKLAKNFDLKKDNKTHLMHNKFFIFDDKKVFTGSANITKTGIGGYNSNSVALINNEKIALAYKNEFETMFNGHFQNNKTHDNSIYNIHLAPDLSISVCFSPRGDVYNKMIKPSIVNAKKKIYVSIFYLTHRKLMQELVFAHIRGVEIKIIMDATSAKNPKSQLKTLRNAKIPVKVENWGGKNHEKTIMIDDEILIFGSANFSTSGFSNNDENVIMIKNSEISKFWGRNFIKLYNSIDNIYLSKIPSAEGVESKYSCYDGIDNDFDKTTDGADSSCKVLIGH